MTRLFDLAARERHLVECDGCGVEVAVLDATDLPASWAAVVERGAVRHYCADCGPAAGSIAAGRRSHRVGRR